MNAITSSLTAIWSSSIGKKIIVALTGSFLVFFLVGHLVGNLLVFVGREAFNDYAQFLHHMIHGAGIWLFRCVMLGTLALHVAATVSLTLRNRAARQPYEHQAVIQASIYSRTMIWSGLTLLAFFIYHMLHFTLRVGNSYDTYVDPEHLAKTGVARHDAWKMVIDGFSNGPVTLFYLIAMTLLCSHLSHGFASIFQTLGLRPKRSESAIRHLSLAYGFVIWAGFIAIPLAILFGIVKA
ncbi:MAG: succinate dehydrogenase cytochrome b subunit [Verrucomicrobia bacterium]|nr:succinate dehydrogenase cytochrome b subunit [Verrucomicrobiota bacterium]